MRSFADLRVFACLVAAVALSACTVEDPGAPNLTTPPGQPGAPVNGTTDFKPAPPVDMADPGPVKPPVLDAIPNLTQYSSIPVHGTATPGTNVLIVDGDNHTVNAEVLTSGRFCADVTLKASAMNTFTLTTVDGNGEMSSPVSLTIQQKGTPNQQQATGMPAANVSIGGATATSLSFNAGSGSSMIDGNAGTAAGAWQSSWSTTDYIMVAASDRRSIDHIRLMAPTSCPLTAPFDLYVSNADAPSDPGTTPTQWTKLKSFAVNEANTDYTVNLQQAVPLTHVALYFDRGWIAWGTDVNCGDDWNGAYYMLSEVQLWSASNVITPPPTSAPSCNSGGN